MWKTLLAAFGAMFLAELGDKTQLAILTLSAKTGAPLLVFLGSMAAFAATTALASAVGFACAKCLPQNAIQWAAGVLFISIGVFIIIGQLRG